MHHMLYVAAHSRYVADAMRQGIKCTSPTSTCRARLLGVVLVRMACTADKILSTPSGKVPPIGQSLRYDQG